MPSEYNPDLNPYRGCVEEREIIDYIEGLLGDYPSLGRLIEYQKRLIDAILELGAWDRAVAAIDACTRIDRSALPSDLRYDEKLFGMAANIAEHQWVEEVRDATEAYFQSKFRAIFDDEEGTYVRIWANFCHTGRTEILLNEFGLLGCLRHLAELISVTTTEAPA